MKKNVIAVIMSLIMAIGSVGGAKAFAAETTATEAMEVAQDEEIVESEKVDENEDTDTGSTDETSEDEIIQEEPEQEIEEELILEPEEVTGESETDATAEEAADESETDAAAEEVTDGQEDASGTEAISETTDDEAEEISAVEDTNDKETIEENEDTVIEEEVLTAVETEAYDATAPIATSESYRSGVYYTRLLNALDTYAGASQVDRFVAIALSQEGYTADSAYGNNSGYGDGKGSYCEYTNPNTIGSYGADWCAAFISWSARMAGLPEAVIPTTAGAGTFRSVGTQHRLWSNDFTTYQDYRPRKGDIILNMPDNNSGKYNGWSLTAHVAIIAEDSTTRAGDGGWLFTTIERNGQRVGKVSGYSTKRTFSNANANNVHMYQMIVTPNWQDSSDTEKPVVRNARITDVTNDGYTVICDVSDNVGVARVTFPTWTDADWQDDIVWKDGTISNGTVTFRVNISDHGNQRGKYWTYIYATDAAGNVSVETDATRLSVELYDQAPKNPTITVSKSHYLPSETIRIRANAEGATSYYGAIYRLGKRIWEGACQSGGIIEYPASQFGQGEYSAYVTCSNDAGWVDTKWVNYTVPYDIGDDFYAFIILQKDWRHLGLSGTNVEIASANDSYDPKQIWRFVKQPNDNSYIAYNMYMSGYENAEWVLSCHNSGSANQTNIEVAKNQNLSSQKWYVYIYDNDQFKLVPGNCSLCMDAANGGTSSGTNIQLYEYNGTYAQGYSVYKLFYDNGIYIRPGKPSASVYTGPAKTDAGKQVTLTWSESAKVNSFDKRSYRLQVFDSNGKSVLNQSGLTALNYNYTFSTPGTYSVQITAVNDYYMDYETAGSKAQIIVNEAVKDLKNLTITGIANKTYTGKNITQAVVVKDGDKTLIAGTDYAVTYKNNKNVGTATVIITGNGSYTGTVEKTFKITAKKITPTLVLSNTTFTYNGAVQMPDETVKDGKTVLAKSNYDISWPSGCVDPGKYSVTVTLKGNYSGTATGTFTILPGKTSRGDMFNLANNVKVTWKEVPGAKYYKVYREGVTDPSESLDEPVIVTERLIGWDTQPGLTNGHAYRYKIVASLTGKGDSSGDSPLSYSKLMYRLKTVVIRSVKNTEPGKVTVKYDRTTSGDSYVLQYCEREDMVGARTKVVLGASNTSYTIGGLKKGKTYYISIRVRKKVDGIDYYTTFGVAKKITVTK